MTNYGNGINLVSFVNGYDEAGNLQSVTSSWSDATHPAALFSGATYSPFGSLSTATFGSKINLNRQFDTRLRITSETDTLVNTSQ
jgi:hypothetical protein